MMQKTVIGVFSERNDAEAAINSLKDENYNPKDLSIVMRDTKEGEDFADTTGTNVATGAASGATTGAVIGGIAGLLIGIGAIAVPGIGAILIGGPLAAALGLTGAAATTVSGAATGALAGGLLGALMGLGVPEEDARIYEERVKAGGILVAVPARSGEEEDVRMLLEDNGADSIRTLHLNSERADTRSFGRDEDSLVDEPIDEADAYPKSVKDGERDYGQMSVQAAGRKGGRSAARRTRSKKTTSRSRA